MLVSSYGRERGRRWGERTEEGITRGVTYSMGLISSGDISNMRGLKWTLTKEDAAIPNSPMGMPAILALHFNAFLSFLYSSNGIILSLFGSTEGVQSPLHASGRYLCA